MIVTASPDYLPEHDNRRAAPRYSLIIRTAKLLCESGEYVCVVRDVSETGAKVRLFHACPPDRTLALELANGDRYAMERVWAKDGLAGFRFAAPIAVEDFIEEPSAHPRRPVRLKVQRPALTTAGGRDVNAMLIDLSQQGACIEAGSQIAIGQQLRLEIEGFPVRFGHVRWRKGFTHGLVFQNAMRLDEFAGHAAALQPWPEGAMAGEEPLRCARFV